VCSRRCEAPSKCCIQMVSVHIIYRLSPLPPTSLLSMFGCMEAWRHRFSLISEYANGCRGVKSTWLKPAACAQKHHRNHHFETLFMFKYILFGIRSPEGPGKGSKSDFNRFAVHLWVPKSHQFPLKMVSDFHSFFES